MKQTIDNAADITVLRTIDNTLKTGGGAVSIGAVALMAGKGRPFTRLKVTDATMEKILGKPLPKKAIGAEGLRHLKDALKELLYCNVVRVVASDYKFPSIAFAVADGAAGTDAHSADTVLSIGAGNFLQFWPVDGDPSVNRSVAVSNVVTDKGDWAASVYAVNDVVNVAGGRLICVAATSAEEPEPTMAVTTAKWRVYRGQYDKRFTLTFYDKDKDGAEYELESYPFVGVDQEDTDDMGAPAYIETLLERKESRFRANFDESLGWADVLDGLKGIEKTVFVGGTNGGEPETDDWNRGWDIFRNESYAANHMFAAGNYDADALANMLDVADGRRSAAYFDVPPTLPPEQALAWLKGTGLESRNARVTYCPFSANDPTYKGPMVWGASGDKVAAKCRGEALFTGATPGVHYAAAGMNRAKLTRTGVKPLFDEAVDRIAFYDARINPVIAADNGGAVIDDDLTLHFKEDYSRFGWVVDIDNYAAHRFYQMAAALKFEPDGLTRAGLTSGMKAILDDLVTSGALVKPRNPEDGDKPYVIEVTQIEIDLWSVVWDICPTGSARRIAGQPRYIK